MRLIDANKLLERMKKGMESGSNLNGTFDLYIEHAPTIDAVKVVRCKDCKHRYGDECPMRHVEWVTTYEEDGYVESDEIVHDHTMDDGFCNCGERERREP